MYLVIIGLLVIIRLAVFVYFVVSEGQYLAPDSTGYINLAKNLLDHQVFSDSMQLPLEPNFFRTPGYPFFLAVLKSFNVGSPYWVIFWQELLYGLTAWFFYHYGQPLFGKSIARGGLLFLLIEPGGFSYPKLILSETLFLPFVIIGLLLIGNYLKKKEWRLLVFSGFIMGLGILVRPGLVYLISVICFTLIVFDFRCRQRWLHTGLFFFTLCLTVSPWLIRNLQYCEDLFISGQHSNLLANYHVPIVWESGKNIPFSKGREIIKDIVETELEKQTGQSLSAIEIFKTQQNVAIKELKKLPADYFKQWIFGALKTMAGMNLTVVYTTLKIHRSKVRFYKIQEISFIKKVGIFLKAQDKPILFMLVLRGVETLLALLGVFLIISRKDCFLWLMMLANFYFIFLPGPVGGARFRFPIEVFWFIQAYYGLCWFVSFWNKNLEPIKKLEK